MDDWKDKLKIYYDAEFTGLDKKTTPISIGLVSESGATFYAEFSDYDESRVTDWIRDNVINRLRFTNKPENSYISRTPVPGSNPVNPSYMMEVKGDSGAIKLALMGWLSNESHNSGGKQIQIYTDCYAYDWIIFNDLIGLNGSALEIPAYVNYIPIDLSTALFLNNIDPDISREEFITGFAVTTLQHQEPFKSWGGDLKHNCLWDAFVCRECFDALEKNVEK